MFLGAKRNTQRIQATAGASASPPFGGISSTALGDDLPFFEFGLFPAFCTASYQKNMRTIIQNAWERGLEQSTNHATSCASAATSPEEVSSTTSGADLPFFFDFGLFPAFGAASNQKNKLEMTQNVWELGLEQSTKHTKKKKRTHVFYASAAASPKEISSTALGADLPFFNFGLVPTVFDTSNKNKSAR